MKIKCCRICHSEEIERILDLGEQPWCNNFVRKEQIGQEQVYPLELCFCCNCSTVQINYTLPKEIMYSDHLYLSGTTQSMTKHFNEVSKKVCSFFNKPGLVVDIGSNDGTLLHSYKNNKMSVLGIEPCRRAAELAIKTGIPTEILFFNYKNADSILQSQGEAQVISAANVFYHIEELHSVTAGVNRLLKKDGVFVIHSSYLPTILTRRAFDIIYHEHLLYYRLYTLNYLLNQHDMEIFDVDRDDEIHGGSIVSYACHKGEKRVSDRVTSLYHEESIKGLHHIEVYQKFAKDVEILRDKIRTLVSKIKRNSSIYAFGAPAKGTVLLNYCGFTNKDICLATEKNSSKFGHYIPCTNIPIVSEDETDEPDYYLLLAWNFIKEFCNSEEYISGRRKFIIPLPEPKILTS